MTRVLYLHGFASSPASTKAQYFKHRLESNGIACDIPALDEGDFESLTISKQLLAAQRTAGDRPVAVIGSSMGGYLAALFAARCPQTRAAVLLAPAFDFANRWRLRLGEQAMSRWRENGSLPVLHYGSGREARVGYRLYEDALGFEAYPVVRCPVLVMHGRNDDVVPYALSEEFVRRTPGADLHILDSGHELTDSLDALWALTWRFLESTRALD